MIERNKIVIISGPTASGKTSYSLKLARENNGVIINADSMQIYKGLPILSAQPTAEEQNGIEHFLFSYLNPDKNCNVGLWLELAKERIDYCFKMEKTPIIVGGTGMYISKLLNGISQTPEVPNEVREHITKLYNTIGHDEFYKKALKIDKEYVEKLNPNDKQRLMRVLEVYEISKKSIRYFQEKGNILLFPREMFHHININLPRELLYKRCFLRFKQMVETDGVIQEIKQFIQNFPNIVNSKTKYSILNTIGLLEAIEYINGKITLDEFIEKSVKITRNYAKRQCTWFNNQFDGFDLLVNII